MVNAHYRVVQPNAPKLGQESLVPASSKEGDNNRDPLVRSATPTSHATVATPLAMRGYPPEVGACLGLPIDLSGDDDGEVSPLAAAKRDNSATAAANTVSRRNSPGSVDSVVASSTAGREAISHRRPKRPYMSVDPSKTNPHRKRQMQRSRSDSRDKEDPQNGNMNSIDSTGEGRSRQPSTEADDDLGVNKLVPEVETIREM